MRLGLTLLALGLVALCFLWFADRPAASRGKTPRGTDPVHAAPTPPEDARLPPVPVRRAAPQPEESTAPSLPPDDFPRSLLAGRVQHSGGDPAAGIALEVRAQSQRGRPRPLAELVTKEDGSFEARVLGTGPFRLEASATSGGGLRLAAVLENVQAGAREVVLVLPHSGRVRGRVVGERKEPVRAFTLELEREDVQAAPVRATIESEDGSFESEELAEGVWQLVVSAEGYAASSPHSISVPGTTAPIRLWRACRLSGVVRGTDGRPRAGAKVELSSAREPVFADANGAFAISGGPGVVRLQATDPSSIAGVPLELQVSPGEERAGLLLQLGASGGVSGRVVTLANRPAAGRSVAFRPLPEAEHESLSPCTTDQLGRFHADLPPGLWEASVALDEREIEAMELTAPSEERSSELRASEEVLVNANETAEVWLALAPAPVRVSGALTKAGERCQGGEVVAIDHRGGARYQARVEGASYALGLGRAGRYEFHVTLGRTTRIEWVDVPAAGAHELDLDVPVGWVEGFVRTPFGERAADVAVWARAPPTPQGGGSGKALTGAEGIFVLELAPGTYEVGTGTEEEGQPPWAWTRSVTLRERERLSGLELVLPRDPASPALEVVLRGPRGELVEGGRVSVTLEWMRGSPVHSVAAPQGSAIFAALPSNEVVVAAEAPGYFLGEFPRVQIEWPKPRRVELALERAFEVVVRVQSGGATGPVRDVDAVAASGLVFDSEPFTADSRPGEPCFRFPLLPLGEVRLRLFAGAQVIERPLRVAEQASLEVSVP